MDYSYYANLFCSLLKNVAYIIMSLGTYGLTLYLLDLFYRKSESNKLIEELSKSNMKNFEKTKIALDKVRTMRDLEYFLTANNLKWTFFKSYDGKRLNCDFQMAKDQILNQSEVRNVAYIATMPKIMPSIFRYISKN